MTLDKQELNALREENKRIKALLEVAATYINDTRGNWQVALPEEAAILEGIIWENDKLQGRDPVTGEPVKGEN